MLRLKIRNELNLKCLLQDDGTCWQVFHTNLQKPLSLFGVAGLVMVNISVFWLSISKARFVEMVLKWELLNFVGRGDENSCCCSGTWIRSPCTIFCFCKYTHAHGGRGIDTFFSCKCRDRFIIIPSCIKPIKPSTGCVPKGKQSVGPAWPMDCTRHWGWGADHGSLARRCCSLRSLNHGVTFKIYLQSFLCIYKIQLALEKY